MLITVLRFLLLLAVGLILFNSLLFVMRYYESRHLKVHRKAFICKRTINGSRAAIGYFILLCFMIALCFFIIKYKITVD